MFFAIIILQFAHFLVPIFLVELYGLVVVFSDFKVTFSYAFLPKQNLNFPQKSSCNSFPAVIRRYIKRYDMSIRGGFLNFHLHDYKTSDVTVSFSHKSDSVVIG